MRFVVALVVLLAVCGADAHAPRVASWRLTHAVRGWPGEVTSTDIGAMGVTGQGQAWALLAERSGSGRGSGPRSWSMLRWDGASWRRAPLPEGAEGSDPRFAASPSGDDLWLFTGDRPFQLTGGRWTHRPWRGAFTRASVAAGAKDDVWVSEYGGPDDYAEAGLSHWDGRSWSPVPQPSAYGHEVSRLAAPGRGELWAVVDGMGQARVIRWNGSGWAATPLPPAPGCPPAPAGGFYGMAARARDDVWLITQAAAARSGSCAVPDRGLVARWDGTAWTWPDLPLTQTWLPDVAADRVGGVWIAANPAHGQPYVLNFRNGRWTRSALPADGGWAGFVDIAPVPGTTRLWALARRGDGTLLLYELA
ncbi:hypothetical protein [Nonomuraea roseoviolacea]|uniref:WD40 repeat domain-containing protein n=1 Tax=Nonomuraea roseoviolacea subsp. carminata TaxID=160689 RepID=A0ABT1KFV9_9ACTN|nr:hypothetical protein [Nonomuraea roseoviolacea]MCP2352871.1 hypothetical protein [Nonomuraea roseoviolacea subsp. carminata]